MPQSTLLRNMRARIVTLRQDMLSFPSSDSLAQVNQDRLRSFKLLVHAELEWYIEEAARTVLSHCRSEWTISQRICPSLSCMILYQVPKFPDRPRTIREQITSVLNSYEKAINNNNGIKEANLMRIVVPLGIGASSLDTTWLSTIDSYGQSRGEVAHTSYVVHRALDRNTELQNLRWVLRGLGEFDRKVQKLLVRRKKFY